MVVVELECCCVGGVRVRVMLEGGVRDGVLLDWWCERW